MKPEDFTTQAPGEVVRSVLGHWTFLPNPLPPAIEYTPALVQAVSEASAALGELSGVGVLLPNPFLLIRPFLRREAVLSSRIEGTVTRFGQLLLFETEAADASIPDDAAEVLNYVRAMEHGLQALQSGQPIALQLLRELHLTLMEGVRGEEKNPGRFRDRAVLIGQVFDFEQARFVPPCHTRLEPLLHDLIDYIRGKPSESPVVQAALAHYQFEAIHPFNDGNGRIGRLLIALMLAERGALRHPLLYLSSYFEHHRQEYYDRLLAVSTHGDWNGWLTFFCRGVHEQCRDACHRAALLIRLMEEFRSLVRKATRSAVALTFADVLFATPVLTVNQAAHALKVTYKAADRTVQLFCRLGLLSEVTGRRRNRVFQSDRILHLLEAPLAAGAEATSID